MLSFDECLHLTTTMIMIENIAGAIKSSLPSYFLLTLHQATNGLFSVTIRCFFFFFFCFSLWLMSYSEMYYLISKICQFFRYLSVISFTFNSIVVREQILYVVSSFRFVKSIGLWPWMVYNLGWTSANLLLKTSDRKYFRLCGPNNLYHDYSALLL